MVRRIDRRSISSVLKIAILVFLPALAFAFISLGRDAPRHFGSSTLRLWSTTESGETRTTDLSLDRSDKQTQSRPPCYYRTPTDRWKQRLELSDLSVGQELVGVVVQEKLSGAKTGAKLWLDVGVGRYKNDKWAICTAMLRLGHGKESAARKKAARLRDKKAGLTVFVSRIRLQQDQFEVVLSPDDVSDAVVQSSLRSVSSLCAGDEVKGTVVRVEDFGAIVSLDGYNRPGLLHIRRVADLYGSFINKKKGIEEAGLERKSRVRLQVAEAVIKKRVFLDFTNDVKEESAEEQRQKVEAEERAREETRLRIQQQRERTSLATVDKQSTSISVGSATEVVAWDIASSKDAVSVDVDSRREEAKGDEGDHEDDEDDYDDEEDGQAYDSYDEERDIEDALGLGTY